LEPYLNEASHPENITKGHTYQIARQGISTWQERLKWRRKAETCGVAHLIVRFFAKFFAALSLVDNWVGVDSPLIGHDVEHLIISIPADLTEVYQVLGT
jgi:hypothetical protein